MWNLLYKLRFPFHQPRRPIRARPTNHFVRPRLESLEDRIIFAVDVFSGGAPGAAVLWSNAAAWSLGAPPAEGDDVIILVGSNCLFSNSSETKVNSLTIDPSAALTVDNGPLTVVNATTVDSGGSLTVADGTLSGQMETGTLSVPGGSSTTALTLNNNGLLEVDTAGTVAAPSSIGGTLEAMNISSSAGAVIDLTGTGVVTGTGALKTEINANVNFDLGSAWELYPGAALTGDSAFNIDAPLTIDGDLYKPAALVLNNDGSTSAGALTGAGQMATFDDFTWNGGTLGLSGPVSIEQGTFKTAGSDAKTLSTELINVNLDTSLDGTAPITISSSGSILNDNGAFLDVTAGLTGPGTLTNNGDLKFTAGTTSPSSITVSCPLVSDNAVNSFFILEPNAPPVNLTGTTTLGGYLEMNDGSLTLAGTTTIASKLDTDYSPTDRETISGTLSVNSGVRADFDHVVLTGSVTGPGDFSIGADGLHADDYLNWNAGASMTGSGSTTIGGVVVDGVPQGATLNILGNVTLDDRTLDNKGIVDWQSGTLTLADTGGTGGPTINNDLSALFEDNNPRAMFSSSGTTPTFNNQGEILKGTASGTSSILQVPFAVNCSIASGDSNTADGEIDAAAGMIDLMGGGSSNAQFAAASGASIIFDGSSWSLTGGGFTGPGSFNNDTTMDVAVDGTTPALYFAGGALFTNAGLATFSVDNDTSLQETGSNTFDNQGTFVKSGGTGTTTVGLLFDNEGLVDAASGTLALEGGGTSTGTLESDAGAALVFGTTSYTWAGATLQGSGGFTISSGTVRVTDYVTGTGVSLAVTGGRLDVEAGASLSVGTYSQGSNGTLEVDLSGPSFGGQLNVSGQASVDGTLSAVAVDGYQPNPGDSFLVLTYGSRSGSFATVNVPSGMSWEYDSTDVDVYDPT
jgi:fibronectin-binding autotransporter adhesin